SSDYEHFFAGIVMPTETKEAYLVDASFVQVFAGLNERKRGVLSSPGKRILSSPLGMRVAQELIDRGFVRLTDEVATVYGQALTGTDRSFHVSDFVTSSPHPQADQRPYIADWRNKRELESVIWQFLSLPERPYPAKSSQSKD